MVVILVMHRQLLQILAPEGACATCAYPREKLERPFAVTLLAQLRIAPRLGDHLVQPAVVRRLFCCHMPFPVFANWHFEPLSNAIMPGASLFQHYVDYTNH